MSYLDDEQTTQQPNPDWHLPPVKRWEEPPPHTHCDGYYRHGTSCCGCGEHPDLAGEPSADAADPATDLIRDEDA